MNHAPRVSARGETAQRWTLSLYRASRACGKSHGLKPVTQESAASLEKTGFLSVAKAGVLGYLNGASRIGQPLPGAYPFTANPY